MAQAIVPAMMLIGGAISYNAARKQGRAAEMSANIEAEQLEQAAMDQEASAQRSASEQRRQARLLQSRAIAVAAASGGGAVGDKNVDDILLNLAGEGEYRALTSLYEGKSAATNLRTRGMATRFQGQEVRRAADRSWINQVSSVAGSMPYSSFGTKYGNSFNG